eukprot:IDg17712t1
MSLSVRAGSCRDTARGIHTYSHESVARRAAPEMWPFALISRCAARRGAPRRGESARLRALASLAATRCGVFLKRRRRGRNTGASKDALRWCSRRYDTKRVARHRALL